MKLPHQPTASASMSTESKIPLYHQVFLLMKSKISDGEYRPGDYLPSERDLSEIFKVSRITTMRALNELAACGLVVRETGRGTRVRFAGHGVVIRGAAPGEHGTATEWPELPMEPIDIKVMEFSYLPATPKVAEALQINPGASVQCSIRVLEMAGAPFAHLTTFVPAETGRRWTAADMEAKPLHHILDQLGHSIERVDESVTATLSDMALSEQLKLTVGEPLIKILRTSYSNAPPPVMHMVGLFRPDRYRYDVSLSGSALPGNSHAF